MEPIKRPFGTKATVYLTDDEITKLIDILHDESNPNRSPYDSLLDLDYITTFHVKDLMGTIGALQHEISYLHEAIEEKNITIARLRKELDYLYQDVKI